MTPQAYEEGDRFVRRVNYVAELLLERALQDTTSCCSQLPGDQRLALDMRPARSARPAPRFPARRSLVPGGGSKVFVTVPDSPQHPNYVAPVGGIAQSMAITVPIILVL